MLMEERKVEETIEIEQEIMSGLDLERNEALNPETILKNVQSFCNRHASECPDIVMRVIALLITHYEVPDKTFQDFLKKIRNSP